MALTEIGNFLLGLASLSAIVSLVALVWGHLTGPKEGEGITNTGYFATFASAGFLTLGVLLLLSAFLSENMAFKYVAENHTTDVSNLRWLFMVSGVWAGREGSLLFWAWLLSLFIAWIAWRRISVTDKLTNVSLAVADFVQLFFLAALFVQTNNPFQASPPQYFDQAGQLISGTAMNPLLQHWAMILHPPTLFIGYAGLTIPFAFAMGAILLGDGSKKWVELSSRITVFSWLFLGIGIGLGAIWAYVVLGWGGYWAWDPVENASLLPWLTGVGLLHSFTVYRRRDGFKKWAVFMSAVTLTLVLLGTFITRSGILQDVSVHSFQADPVSFWLFLGMMVGIMAAGVIGLLARSEQFKGQDEFESLLSKESSYYFNNVLMLISSLLVAYMTVAAALPSWMPLGGQSFGAPNYDAIARPVGILYILIMAVCPILSWRHTEGETFWNRIKWPAAGAAVLAVAFLAIFMTVLRPNYSGANPIYDEALAIFGLLVGALAIALPIYLFIDGARKRAEARGEGFGTALLNIMTKARATSGGYLTHLGMGIILVGLIGSAMFVKDLEPTVQQQPGAKFDAAGYTFVFQKIEEGTYRNGDQYNHAIFNVQRGGRTIRTINPEILFPAQNPEQRKLNVDIISEPLRDVFVSFQGVDQSGLVSMSIKINPLIWWVWIGFALTVAGTTLAVWPKAGTGTASA